MPTYLNGDGRIDGTTIYAGTGFLGGSVVLATDSFSFESLQVGRNFDNGSGVPTVPFASGQLVLTNGADVTFSDLGSGDPVDGFSPFARVGENFSQGGLAQGSIGVFDGSTISFVTTPIEQNGAFGAGYSTLRLGRNFGGQANLTVAGVDSAAFITGGAARLDIGRDGGVGDLDIRDGGYLATFNLTAGRQGFALVSVEGQGSTLSLGGTSGYYASNNDGKDGSHSIGRDLNGRAVLSVTDGGYVTATNNPGTTDGPNFNFGRGYGSFGYGLISGTGSSMNIAQQGAIDPGVFGSSLTIGTGGRGILVVENNATVSVTGEDAFIAVGQNKNAAAARFDSQLIIRNGGVVTLDSQDNGAQTGPGTNMQIGKSDEGRGKVVVDGAGSRLEIRSDNGGLAGQYATQLSVGFDGSGQLEVTNGGQVEIDGRGDRFPAFLVGNTSSATTNPTQTTSHVLISGAGSRIDVGGTNTDIASFISIGRRDQKTGILVIEDGGVLANDVTYGSSEIAGNAGSTGILTVDGAGSAFYAGAVLAISTDYVNGAPDTSIGGNGTLTIRNQGYVAAGAVYVGDSGTLNLGGYLTGDTTVTGVLNVGGAEEIGDARLEGNLDAAAGQIRLEAFDFATGNVDTLTVIGSLEAADDQIILDVSNLARATIGESITLLSASEGISANFSASDLDIIGAAPGVFVGVAKVGGVIGVSISIAPAKTVGLLGGDVSVLEGDPGDDTRVTFTVLRSGDLSTTMDVDFAVSGGSAVAADFLNNILPSGTVTFGVGEDSTTIEVQLAEDNLVEGDETFDLVLSNPTTGDNSAVSVLNAANTVTIRDDDVAASAVSTGAIQVGASIQLVQIDPTSTFLRTDVANDPGVTDAVAIDLASLGFAAGDALLLRNLGDIVFDNTGVQVAPSMIGAFSASNTLFGGDILGRIADILATPGSETIVTEATNPAGIVTDIAEDFAITGGVVLAPTSATHLFVGLNDSFFSDNADPDFNFGLLAVKPNVFGLQGAADAHFAGQNFSDAALIVGLGENGDGEVLLEDSDWFLSAGLAVGVDGGASGRLILDTRSDVIIADPGIYGVPTGPLSVVGGSSASGYLALQGGSRLTIASDQVILGPDRVLGGYDNLRIGTDTGIGTVLVEGDGSTLTLYGYSAQFRVGADGGTGTLDIRDGGVVQSMTMEAGQTQGNAIINVTGAGSELRLSNAVGIYGQAQYQGFAGTSNIGREYGSGDLRVSDGGRVLVENIDGLTDGAQLRFGRDLGSEGRGLITGAGSRLDIIQNGQQGDSYIANPALRIGDGGTGELIASYGAEVLVQGDGAQITIARGRNGTASQYASSLQILSGATVTVDSLGYGVRQQDILDDQGTVIDTRDGGSSVRIAQSRNTVGELTVDGAGSRLIITSSSVRPSDYSTADLRVGTAGTGQITVSNGGFVSAREISLGDGFEYANGNAYYGNGTLNITSGGIVEIYTPDNPLKATNPNSQPSVYRGLRLGTYGTGSYGRANVDGDGTTLTISGGAGRMDIGRQGTGILSITNGGLAQGFFVEAGRDGNGRIYVDGAGSQLIVENQFGVFGYGNEGQTGLLRLGRNDGAYGRLDITNGGNVTIRNSAGTDNDEPRLEVARRTGAEGVLNVDGPGSTLDLILTGPSNDVLDFGNAGYYGPELRIGREGGQGTANVINGGTINITGEQAELVVGRGADENGFTALANMTIASGGTVNVSSLGYEVGGYAQIGKFENSRGRLVIDGPGSALNISSSNIDDVRANGNTAFAAGMAVGLNGEGELVMTNGAEINIDGADDAFPAFIVGRNDGGSGTALISGAGTAINVIGTNTGSTDTGFLYGGGSVLVGLRDGSTGDLTIADGATITNSAQNSRTNIGSDTGSNGTMTVQGAGSRLEAGHILLVGRDIELDSAEPNAGSTFEGGTGVLSILDGGEVSVGGFSEIGSTGTLNLASLLDTPVLIQGGLVNVGGDNAIGTGEITGLIENTANAEYVFEFLGFGAGQADLLVLSPNLDETAFGTPTFTLDMANLAAFNSGDAVKIVDFDGAAPDPDLLLNTNFVFANVASGLSFDVLADGEGDWIVQGNAAPLASVALAGFDQSQPEGDLTSDAVEFTYTVARSGDLNETATVDFTVVGNGTNPANGGDFEGGVLPSGQVTFSVGQTEATITLAIAEDTLFEPDEDFVVQLSNATGSVNGALAILNNELGGTIENDDSTLIVTTLDDVVDENDGELSLREAVASANAEVGTNIVTFAGGLSGTLRLTQGEIEITDTVEIQGDGRVTITGDANGDDVLEAGTDITDVEASLNGQDLLADNSRIFNISSANADTTLGGLTLTGGHTRVSNVNYSDTSQSGGALRSQANTLSISDTTISGNSTAGDDARGGAVYSSGSTTLMNSAVTNNLTTGNEADGGGIYSAGATIVTSSTIAGNSTSGLSSSGGGVVSNGGTYPTFGGTTITNSTISGNSTAGDASSGGGIYARFGDTTVTNSTISGNSTDGSNSSGGGLASAGPTVVTSSTVSGNSTAAVGAAGGGVAVFDQLTLTNSIISGNVALQASDDEVLETSGGGGDGTPDFLGQNIVGGDVFNGIADVGDATADQVFGATFDNNGVLAGVLGDNGGSVPTIAILSGGAAHDTGSASALPADSFDLDGDGDTIEPLPLDAIGNARVRGDAPDLGAVELEAADFNGSGGDDDLTGSGAANTILGLAGNDTIDAGAGNDIVDAGLGDDTADGGAGVDTISFASLEDPSLVIGTAEFGVFVDLGLQGAGQATGAGTDLLTGFENIEGSDLSDLLTGDDGDNGIFGGGGGDLLRGGAGNDTLDGGAGFDAIDGGPGADLIFGGDGFGDIATYFSATGPLTFVFGADFTQIETSSSPVVAEDQFGADIEGVAGASGFSNTFDGSAITGLSFFLGGGQSDTFFGGSGTDQLIGLAGNDEIHGNGGVDALIGNAGDDDLFGGAGADVFFFDGIAEGDDLIRDFAIGEDLVFFTGGVTSGAQLSFSTVDGDNDGQVDDGRVDYTAGGQDSSITFVDIDGTTLETTAGIFIF